MVGYVPVILDCEGSLWWLHHLQERSTIERQGSSEDTFGQIGWCGTLKARSTLHAPILATLTASSLASSRVTACLMREIRLYDGVELESIVVLVGDLGLRGMARRVQTLPYSWTLKQASWEHRSSCRVAPGKTMHCLSTSDV